MAISSQKLIEMGWRSTKTETGNQIILFLFSAFPGGKTQDEIRKELIQNKKKFKEEDKDKKIREFERHSPSKDSLNNIVSNYLTAFFELEYCIKLGEKREFKKDGTSEIVRIDKYHKNWEYALQLKFFFDWANEKKLPEGKKLIYIDPKKKKAGLLEEHYGDAWYLDWDMISDVRKIILKYPEKNLIDKIKLYLFDAYVLQKLYLRLDDNTREKIRLIVGLPSNLSKEIREYYGIDREEEREKKLKEKMRNFKKTPKGIKLQIKSLRRQLRRIESPNAPTFS